MKLRYQLRGLGIGMAVTALLMGVATGNGASMSDAEIRAKALELGMVEGDSLKLTDIVTSPAPDAMGAPSSEGNGSASQGVGVQSTPSLNNDIMTTNIPQSVTGSMSTNVPSSAGGSKSGTTGAGSSSADGSISSQGVVSSGNPVEDREENGGSDAVTIVIEQGEIASEICVKLAEAGLIDNALAFETYLCENNWSRTVRDGIYTIPFGTTMEDIAKMIAGNP